MSWIKWFWDLITFTKSSKSANEVNALKEFKLVESKLKAAKALARGFAKGTQERKEADAQVAALDRAAKRVIRRIQFEYDPESARKIK